MAVSDFIEKWCNLPPEHAANVYRGVLQDLIETIEGLSRDGSDDRLDVANAEHRVLRAAVALAVAHAREHGRLPLGNAQNRFEDALLRAERARADYHERMARGLPASPAEARKNLARLKAEIKQKR